MPVRYHIVHWSLYRHHCPSYTIYCTGHSTDITARHIPYIALITLETSIPVRYHILHWSPYSLQRPLDVISCTSNSPVVTVCPIPYIVLVTLETSMPVIYHIVHGYSTDINARQISYIALVTLQTSMLVRYHTLHWSLYRHQCLHILNRSLYRHQCTSDTIYCTGHSRDINARQIPYIALVTLQTSMPSVTI